MDPSTVLDIERLWDYGDPAASEARFRAIMSDAEPGGDETYRAELLTQIARAEGLQGRFADAEATLAAIAPVLAGARPRTRVRWLLERGRVLNSAGRPAEAVPLFLDALALARAVGETYLAVDAAHMLGIAAAPERRPEWHRRAIALAEAADDPRTRYWLGSLLNNLGWTLHDAGAYDEALAAFERAAAWREAQGQETESRIARWAVGRCLRSLGRVEEALAIQERLRGEFDKAGADDPYVDEELGECLLALGRGDEARPWFERAAAGLAGDAWLVEHAPERVARLRRLGAGGVVR